MSYQIVIKLRPGSATLGRLIKTTHIDGDQPAPDLNEAEGTLTFTTSHKPFVLELAKLLLDQPDVLGMELKRAP